MKIKCKSMEKIFTKYISIGQKSKGKKDISYKALLLNVCKKTLLKLNNITISFKK
jgi:hypothetical protein